ncbi:MAG: hypothetical protein C0404_07160 [Verrucomicrobia bacterium]|nr:hypothetical protein [Verrucomicrobiota bacterium]
MSGSIKSALFIFIYSVVFALAGNKPASENSATSGTTNAAAGGEISSSVAAIRRAVEYFRNVSTNDFEGWFVPPERQRKAVGSKDVEVRFTRKTVDVPEYEMKKVEVWVSRKAGESVDAAAVREKVTTYESTGRKIGSHKEERLIADPKGEIVKTQKQPIMGPGGPDIWYYGYYGDNAMVIHAMLKAGVDPADPVLTAPADKLKELFTNYGLPDGTWDLAWLAAAFSGMGGDYTNMAVKAAAKLVDGQIRTGPAAGLWGPVCVNTRLVAAMMDGKQDLDELYLKLTRAAQAKKANPKEKEKDKADPNAILAQIRQISDKYNEVSMLCFYTDHKRLQSRIPLGKLEGQDMYQLSVPGLTQYIFNQNAADMGSTAVALYALRVVKEKGFLPEMLARPLDPKGKPFLAAEQSRAVLSKAAATILQSQLKNGGWTELNIHQAVADFNSMKGLSGVPGKGAFPALESPTNFCSSAQGMSALVNLKALVGKEVDQAGNVKMAADYLGQLHQQLQGNSATNLTGGHISPYDSYFYLTQNSIGATPVLPDDLRQSVAAYLTTSQGPEGGWEKQRKQNLLFLPTSYFQRMQVLEPIAYKGVDKLKDPDFEVPHVWLGMKVKEQRWSVYSSYHIRPDILATAYALLTLVGLEPLQGQ